MSKEFHIYLAGAMSGISYAAMQTWRKEVELVFNNMTDYGHFDKIYFFNPVDKFGTAEHMSYANESFAFETDLRKLKESNMVICNLSTGIKSVGTNVELGVAYENHIPVIVYNPDKVELHPWQQMIANYVAENIESLLDVVHEYYLT